MSNFSIFCTAKNKKPSCDEVNSLPNTGQNLNQTLVAGNFTGGESIRFTDQANNTLVTLQNISLDLGLLMIGADDSNQVGGGAIGIIGGNGVGAGLLGGTITLQGGTTASGTLGGNVDIFGGTSNSAAVGATGGNIRLAAGGATSTSDGGLLTLQGGTVGGAGTGNAGDVIIAGGTTPNAGDGGSVTISSGISTGGLHGNVSIDSQQGNLTLESLVPSFTAIQLLTQGVGGGVTITTSSGALNLDVDTKFFVNKAPHASAILGTAALTMGTVVVNTSSVSAATSEIFITRKSPATGMNTNGALSVPNASIVDGVSFTVNSTSGDDDSTFAWFIIN